MGVLADFKEHWFVTVLCILSVLVFLAALVLSSVSYIRVIDAREVIVLADAQEIVEELTNGSLRIALAIDLRNPSAYDLDINLVSWSVILNISDLGGGDSMPIANQYKSATEPLLVRAGETETFEYEAYVSDPSVLSQIDDYLDAWAEQGEQYTLETAPYVHDFRVTAWLGDFSHDYEYSGELYLNEMVKIALVYHEGVYT